MQLFADLSDAALEALATKVESIHLPGGATLIKEGDEGDAVYMLVSGRLRAFVSGEDGEIAVGDVGVGEVVGEMALLTDHPRSATVRGVRDSHLLKLERADFEEVATHHPATMLETARVIVNRLSRSIHGTRSAPAARAIAIVPAGGGADLDGFVRALASAMASIANVEVVDRKRRDAKFGAEEPTPAAMTAWLHQLEDHRTVVLYQSDLTATEWSKRCLRQADRIVLVGNQTSQRDLNEIERSIPEVVGSHGAERVLVLVHPKHISTPRNTRPWLVERAACRPHHVRLDNQGDFGRLARLISGRAVAVVLSGGGARGIAHVGVLRAFEERGIPLDRVGSASFGSIIGGFHAMGQSWAEIRSSLSRFLVEQGSVVDLTAPAASLARGGKIGRQLHEGFMEVEIEDLWNPFFCTSSNLSAGRVEVHDSGRIRDAIRASISIPGVFPPVRAGGGDVLVDGGIMDNLPVSLMKSRNDGGPIVAVNLRGTFEMPSRDLPTDGVLSGWRALAGRLNPLQTSPAIPGIIDVLLRTTETGAVVAAKSQEQSADIVLHPPVSNFALLDFSALDQLIDAGYRYTLDQMDQWDENQLARLAATT